ncbi:MAG: hypothetical protein JWQ38_1559 [Flavipsychrobacter sp.]|nr:hypothetical protein [Flavipsychrobacter sp.]
MNRILLFFLFLIPFIADAQQQEIPVPMFTRDSFASEGRRFELRKNWRFLPGNDTAVTLATADYDDSKWLQLTDIRSNPVMDTFNSVGWFHYHFITDSGFKDIPMALEVTQYGASEVYFDGKRIETFGTINGRDSSDYFDPQYVPFLLSIPNAGQHVISVRYANFDANHNQSFYKSNFRGFKIRLGEAKYAIISDRGQTTLTCTLYIMLFGIFIALAVSHFFLYLYYKASRPNLYFSIFCVSLAVGFFIIDINKLSHYPNVELRNNIITAIFLASGCLSLSGFINKLFSANKLRFKIVVFLSVVAPLLWFTYAPAGVVAFMILAGGVILEAIIFTIRAIYRKVPGAKIVGSGILFFTIFIVIITVLVLSHLSISEDTLLGTILLFTAACAILSIPISLSLYLAWDFARINKDLKHKLQQVETLSEHALTQEQEKKRLLETQNDRLEHDVAQRTAEVVAQKEKIEKQHNELKKEKKKSDDLLLNILPEEVAEELKEKGSSEAKLFNDVTVLFTDFVDFTKAGEAMNPQELVNELHVCFKNFDEIIAKYNIEKIKTIGDAYLAVGGLPVSQADHALNVAGAALEILQFMEARKQQLKEKTFAIRIGIHSGSVVAGIVGVKKFAYDIWGDTVNTAARMEQNSLPGKINISQTTYDLVKDKYVCTHRGEIIAKNKGALMMYFIESARP